MFLYKNFNIIEEDEIIKKFIDDFFVCKSILSKSQYIDCINKEQVIFTFGIPSISYQELQDISTYINRSINFHLRLKYIVYIEFSNDAVHISYKQKKFTLRPL